MSWSQEIATGLESILTDFVQPIPGIKDIKGHSYKKLDIYRIFFKFPQPGDKQPYCSGSFFLSMNLERLVLSGHSGGLQHFFPCEVQSFINQQLPGALYRYTIDNTGGVDGYHHWDNVSVEDLMAAICRKGNSGLSGLTPALNRLVTEGRVDDLSRVLPGLDAFSVSQRLEMLAQGYEARAVSAASKARELRQRALTSL